MRPATPRPPGFRLPVVLLLLLALGLPGMAAAASIGEQAAAPAPGKAQAGATSSGTQAPAQAHLLDDRQGQPGPGMDPLLPQAAAASGSSGLPPVRRPRKPLVNSATQAPKIVPIGGDIPDGPVAADNAPVQSCGDMRPAACNLDYKPVCARVLTGVMCARAPCPEASERKTFSNACKACRDPKVHEYVSGTCPKG